MNEELRNRNNELSDAALESVGGGTSYFGLEVERICASCPSSGSTDRYSCTYEGGDPAELKRMFLVKGINQYQPHTYFQCPYLKQP